MPQRPDVWVAKTSVLPSRDRLGNSSRPGALVVHVTQVGLDLDQAERTVRRLAINGRIPEPLRTAHLIAGALGSGQSRGRV